jgi:hypothetical protein
LSESAHITQIGLPPWNDKGLKATAVEFSELYKSRPIQNNQGGVKAPHMFAVFGILKALRPEAVIESGVWRGAGTWLIEQAAPEAEIFALDPNLNRLQYRSSRASYSTIDFNLHDWSELPDSTIVLFDDHQDAFVRMQQSLWHGIRHVIFEDNYPPTQGDCYSLKKLFSGAGFKPAKPSRGLLNRFSKAFQEANCSAKVLPGTEQQASVKKTLRSTANFRRFSELKRRGGMTRGVMTSIRRCRPCLRVRKHHPRFLLMKRSITPGSRTLSSTCNSGTPHG